MYLVVNIGCLDCRVSSQIVGLFETEEEASEIARKCLDKYSWRECGNNNFEVFPLPPVGILNDEYEF